MIQDPSMDIYDTCKHAALVVTTDYLIEVLGDPHVQGDYPTTMQWMFRDSLNQRWTIYEHKDSVSVGGECGMDVDSQYICEFIKHKLPNARLFWLANANGNMSSRLMEIYMEYLIPGYGEM